MKVVKQLMLPLLKTEGYPDKFRFGLCTAAGSMGLLFPPSLPLLVYGMVGNVEINKLFVAGLLPGLVTVLALCVPFLFMCNVAGIVCDALALLRPKLALQTSALAVLLVGMWLALPHGLTAVVWVALAVEAARWLVYMLLLVPVLHLRWSEVLRVQLAVAVMAGSVWAGVSAVAGVDGLTAGPRLLCAVLAGAVAALAALLLARGLLRPTGAYALMQQRMPALRRWL